MAEEKPYWQRRRDAKLANTEAGKLKAEHLAKKDVPAFFKLMIEKAPSTCMECSKSLAGTRAINPAAIVAHILPKKHFRSIQTDPANIVYLCIDCHTMLDTGGELKVKRMKIFKYLFETVKSLIQKMRPEEKRHIPKYYL